MLIMLTRLNEQVVKCAPYFPDAAGGSAMYGAHLPTLTLKPTFTRTLET